MKKLNPILSIFAVFAALISIFSSFALTAYAGGVDNIGAGEYNISATLSCYVNAMGGVEFGKPLLTSSTLIVDKSGNKKIKMNFTKSSVTIYNITCDTFVDANPDGGSERGVKSGTIGYYNKDGKLITDGVSYTLSKNTAENSKKEQVNYVDSITFPIDTVREEYSLTLYINSNVMGVQFCNKNDSATEATYAATLTVDWNSVNASSSGSAKKETTAGNSSSGSSGSSSNNQSASGGSTTASSSGSSSSGSSSSGSSSSGSSSGSGTQTTAGGTTSGATTTAQSQKSAVSDNLIEKDGLNIHYVNGDSALNLTGSDSDVPFYVYLNMPVLIGMIIFGAVLTVAGAILLYVSRRQRKKAENEQNS